MEHNHARLWRRAALGFVIIQSLISIGLAQIVCPNPLKIGEFRNFKSQGCVDAVAGDTRAKSDVLISRCMGGDDQQFTICGDGTIRNLQNDYCLQPEGGGISNVVSSTCTRVPSIPPRQRWRLGNSLKQFKDAGGITQVASQVINIESNKCLVVVEGDIRTHDCNDDNFDHFFYIRTRGKELRHGILVNEASGLCLDIDGTDGKGAMSMANCDDKEDQLYRFYENGEIVNEKSKWCVAVQGATGYGRIVPWYCEHYKDALWTMPKEYCDGDYCSFVNVLSGQCINVDGYDGIGFVDVNDCELLPDQRFKWVSGNWEAPTTTWINVGCNQNGQVSQEISNTISYESTLEVGSSIEISATIGTSLWFLDVEVSTTIAASLSKAWTHSQEGSTTVSMSCEYYDNGEEFTKGCMWQLEMNMKHAKTGKFLVWTPQIIKCTDSNDEPKCAPFSKCTNEDCTHCEEF